jgi:hypothetical protein
MRAPILRGEKTIAQTNSVVSIQMDLCQEFEFSSKIHCIIYCILTLLNNAISATELSIELYVKIMIGGSEGKNKKRGGNIEDIL